MGQARFSFNLLVCCAFIVVLAAGCVGERSFYISQNQVPSSSCTVSSSESSELYLPRGLLDISVDKGYYVYPLVNSALQASSSEDGEPERNNLFIREFKVEVDLGIVPGTYSAELTNFTVPQSGILRPGGMRAFSVKVLKDELIARLDESKIAAFRPTITVKIQAVGELGGSTLESMPFYFPIELCSNCLVTRLNTCPETGATEWPKLSQSNSCGVPQDALVQCCDDSQKGLICLPGSG